MHSDELIREEWDGWYYLRHPGYDNTERTDHMCGSPRVKKRTEFMHIGTRRDGGGHEVIATLPGGQTDHYFHKQPGSSARGG